MDINNLQRASSYSYRVDADRIKQRSQQADKGIATDRQQGDSVDISGEGRRALMEEMSAVKKMKQAGYIGKLSPVTEGGSGIFNDFEKVMSELGDGSVSADLVTKDYSQTEVDALKARFEKEEGAKTDSFDRYANKMAAAYQLMKGRIEEKYAAADRQKEYYTAADGSMQELTKEKEMEMLDNAYETHSRFMAANTQIWSELQDFKVQIDYHSSGAKTAEKQDAGIRKQAYSALMSAISGENSGLLKQKTGSLNHFRLDLGIPSSARDFLNGIWDYHANLKH